MVKETNFTIGGGIEDPEEKYRRVRLPVRDMLNNVSSYLRNLENLGADEDLSAKLKEYLSTEPIPTLEEYFTERKDMHSGKLVSLDEVRELYKGIKFWQNGQRKIKHPNQGIKRLNGNYSY